MHFSKIRFLVSLLSLPFIHAQTHPNLTSVLYSNPDLSDLTDLLKAAPDVLKAVLEYPHNLTIIAPTNGAFDELMKMNGTTNNPIDGPNETSGDTLKVLLAYHVLNGTFLSSMFKQGETAAAETWLHDNKAWANLAEGKGQVVLGRTSGSKVILYGGLGMASGVTQAVSISKYPAGISFQLCVC